MTTRKSRENASNIWHVFPPGWPPAQTPALLVGAAGRVAAARSRSRRAWGGLQTRLPLKLYQLGGFGGQVGKRVAKGFGNDLVGAVQVLARVNQVAGRLHGLGATDGRQDGSHRVGVVENVSPVSTQLRLPASSPTAASNGLGRRYPDL